MLRIEMTNFCDIFVWWLVLFSKILSVTAGHGQPFQRPHKIVFFSMEAIGQCFLLEALIVLEHSLIHLIKQLIASSIYYLS